EEQKLSTSKGNIQVIGMHLILDYWLDKDIMR
ncbi:MAG: hypothetical protein K0S04_1784, partial [Herbinix sp.]|nr:hypothetical protein [Herbinix sp.]